MKLTLITENGQKEFEAVESGFPNFKTVIDTKRFLLFFKKKIERKITNGWEALGEKKGLTNEKGHFTTAVHAFCHTRVHVGRENGRLFIYCPMCMVKMDN